ncbi:MAG: retroviral-like aspartic protease family protein [Planctomycetaceae bacterium]
MESATMGRVVVKAKIANLSDLYMTKRGLLEEGTVRTLEVEDALIDTGASTLSLPERLVRQLGLQPFSSRHVRTASGPLVVTVYDSVRLTVQGRECTVDVIAIPDDCPVLIGQIPLELLDFVVDPNGQRLIGNPEHGGQQMLELFSFLPRQS